MAGARIILNSRYFHIAQPGEKAGGKFCMTKEAAAGLVDYVATREGVSLNFNALNFDYKTAQKSATLRQVKLIEQLFEVFPESKNTFEYKDYLAKPNIANASEFIARAAELGFGYDGMKIDEATNLVEYVAKRPGADRVGEHGLFSSEPNISISKAQNEIANCKGNIWTHVISIRREDADRLGYDHQKPWRDMVISHVDKIAEASNIPINQLHWYAGMHNTGHHPHIHLFVFSDDPKYGHLTADGINKMKAEFSEVIFHDERLHIYEHKDEMKQELKDQVNNLLSSIKDNPAGQLENTDLNKINVKLQELAINIGNQKGKISYGYLPHDIKQKVNDLLADITKAPNIQKLYELYCQDHKELEKMYRNEPSEAISIINNKEFTNIKNLIIKEAVKLGAFMELEGGRSSAFDNNQNSESNELSENFISAPLTENDMSLFDNEPPLVENDSSSYSFDVCEPTDSEIIESAESSLSADESLFETEPPSDIERAHLEDYEPPAVDHSSSNRPHKTNEDFNEIYGKAVAGDAKSQYKLAKFYFYGNHVERDYSQAQMWYGLAAASGHSNAKYELGKMYLYGIGIEKDALLGKEYCLAAYWDFRETIAEKLGMDIGRSIDANIPLEDLDIPDVDEKDSYTGYLEYCIGRMEYAGEGVERDYTKSLKWFAGASFHKHVHSHYYLGKQYYGGEGVEQNYSSAAGCYKSATDSKDKYACYALGKMYYDGKGIEQNYEKAASLFSQASKENVPYADYALAKMREQGLGVDKDTKISTNLYKKALDEFMKQDEQQPDAFTEYRIAQMYLTGKGIEQNTSTAAEWLTKCAEKDNPRAQYQLADLYQRGEGVNLDGTKAYEFYKNALIGFINLEQDTPSAAQEYTIAKMYQKGLGTEIDIPEAIKWFTVAAEQGHAHAAYRLGKLYADFNQDYAMAVEWFTKAAEADNQYAMHALGKLYYNGTGVEQDYKKAASWYSKCALPYAVYTLAQMYEKGLGVNRDIDIANHLYKEALDKFIEQDKLLPDGVIECRIAQMYLKGKGINTDSKTAADWFAKSATLSNNDAQYQLAALYQHGDGVEINNHKSFELYQKALSGYVATEKDEFSAAREYKIADMYEKGLGTKIDIPKAINWFTVAAEQGHAHAAYRLGKLYEDGKCIQPDYSLAVHWYMKAAELNDEYAKYSLGKMYLKGTGVMQNTNTAFHFILEAAQANHEFAQLTIAKMYLRGIGVDTNALEAVKWFRSCAVHGNADAQYQLAEMFQKGQGVIPNPGEAAALYNQSLGGFIKRYNEFPTGSVAYRIGNMYQLGLGIAADQTQANAWFSEAVKHYTEDAIAGNANSMCSLAKMYQHGIGVKKNSEAAKYWYQNAADNGNEYAKEQVDKISSAEQFMENSAILGALGGIIRSLSRSIGNNIIDSTTHKYRADRKLLQKQQAIKSSLGQKNDQEQYM